ncbi:MAG TPA: hypothetical protein VJ485_03575 [archaeon]|nr:hypothetical protein [archaeon]
MKAQVSFEYMMVFGLAIAFAIPVWIYIATLQGSAGEELSLSYAKNAASQVTSAADLVYTQGPPAKVTLDIYIPSRIANVTISGKTVVLNVSSSAGFSDVFSSSVANLTGNLSASEGMHKVTVESKGDYVEISYG